MQTDGCVAIRVVVRNTHDSRATFVSFAPPGLADLFRIGPTACAVGCIPSPLRGWGDAALGAPLLGGFSFDCHTARCDKKRSFQEEFVAFLKRNHIEYDARYVWD